ncbi:HAD family hydrolase [Aquibacillus rhizosphaerae]|uniref:HAD family hydrolase n=1 Tax=Aquibacillus rhizosphaerae TaxID=3051431 RepID=A0ABT7L0F5_9BACI|nr:HAD family hydrolase [Aquibacillus sp. LR5S19]MDL4839252.1 HAD family hydrolase [Aquibacillus sp. LR5S19]
MRNIKAILFDKDGTLMNFHSVWTKSIKELLQELSKMMPDNDNAYKELSASIGLHGDELDGNGILAGGTVKDIAEAFALILNKHSQDVELNDLNQWISSKMLLLTKKYITEIRPVSDDLEGLLAQLNKKGIAIGIATADDYLTTEVCLEHLKIKKYFDFVFTSDKFPYKKPDPSVLIAFCNHYNLKAEEVAVIGDTQVDLNLAKNAGAGLAVGVLSGASNRSQLEPLADIILGSVADILNKDDEFIWDSEPYNKEIS